MFFLMMKIALKKKEYLFLQINGCPCSNVNVSSAECSSLSLCVFIPIAPLAPFFHFKDYNLQSIFLRYLKKVTATD